MMAWNDFTPWTAAGGGILIGLAASLYVLLNGRIAGVSGVLGGLLRPHPTEVAWRLAFVIGLAITPTLFWLFGHRLVTPIATGYSGLVLAGLLVGFGTRLGSGCTSGHGVCGLSRLSPRSMAATAMFMATGFATVYVIRHILGL